MVDTNSPTALLSALADLLTPMAIRVMASLRIADHLAAGPAFSPQLAEAAGADAGALERLLRHLAGKGLLSRNKEGRYALTPLGSGLRDDHPDGLRRLLDIEGALGRADLALTQLLHSVRTGEPAFPLQFGRPFWEDLAADPARTASFDVQMGADVSAWASAIVPAYDWGSLGYLIDIGGGNGTLLAALLHAYPALRGAVFDQPATAQAAAELFVERGLADRAEALTGNFFQAVPAGAPAYLLTAILHDWSDPLAVEILRRAAEAAGAQASIFVIEKTGAGGEAVSTSMDLRLLAHLGGRERGVSEITLLAKGAGLRRISVHPAGALSIVELRS